MKKLFIAAVIFTALTSCKKNSSQVTPIDPDSTLPNDIKLTINGTNVEKPPMYQASQKFNYLGFGYDVTDRFNDELSIRASVVDVAAYDASGPDRVVPNISTEGSWNTINAENAEDLSERFSDSFEQTAGLKMFGNTIKDLFPGTVSNDKKYVYGYYSNYWRLKSYRFFYDKSVNNFLTPGFKADVALLNAQELVDKYGTHVLTQVSLGSKFDVFYQADVTEPNRGPVITEGLRYAIKRTFGLMTGYLDDVNLKYLNANKSAKIYYTSTGGDASRLKVEHYKDRLFVNITDWLSTTTEDRAKFIGFYEKALVPLDNLIDDTAKKNAVRKYIQQYLASKTVKLFN